ncbi:MAG: phosphoribulokinase, partial [Acidithiobacillus ferriphilus]|jgi:phosphoribulokinase|nr:phosphoribulokinase [Acidithiobacillus ferriphilus]
MLPGSFMSRSNTLVIPGTKMGFAMEVILGPRIEQMLEDMRDSI